MHTAAMTVLAEAGIEGIAAETGLRHVLADLAAPSTAARAALARLGIASDAVDPSQESLIDVVRRLAAAGLDDDSAAAVFDPRGAAVMLALVRQVDRLASLQRAG